MKLIMAPGWEDYTLLDSGNGKRLERFGKYTLVKPDPQCIWQPGLPESEWGKADAVFGENADGKESWIKHNEIPQKWLLQYKNLSFYAKLSPFKHTGVFPEQHVMWDWMSECIAESSTQREKDEISILNLFGYTGIASLTCAAAGVRVTHVDASYPTIGWGRENQSVSELSGKPIRWILDDSKKFVTREIKRGVRYDGILMDPPVFGHGPNGERWEFFESFPKLLQLCKEVLSENPLFVIINAYAISASSIMLENCLDDMMQPYGGHIDSGELALEDTGGRKLSTGIFARWSRDNFD